MIIEHRVFALPLLLTGLLASGCYAEAGASTSSSPAYVEPAPPPPQAVVVQSPPPAPAPPPPEVVPPPPSPEHIWIVGYHRWNGRAYEWQRGHYERRPHANARYVAGHWEMRGSGHVWIDGHWQ